MAEKPNSAEFAGQREHAMLRSRRAGNPGLRLVPEMSKHNSAKVSKTMSSDDSDKTDNHDDIPPPISSSDQPIDYAATSHAILEALRKIKGNIELSAKERHEATTIIEGGTNVNYMHYIIVLFVGLLVGYAACAVIRSQQMAPPPQRSVNCLIFFLLASTKNVGSLRINRTGLHSQPW